MTSFSGNPLRDGAILLVVRELQAINDPLTLANVGLVCEQRFGATFSGANDLLQAELDGALAMLASAAEPATESGVAATPVEPEAEQPEGPTVTREEAQAMARLASDNLARARRDLVAAQSESRTARGVLSEKVLAWQRGGMAPMTQDDLKREFLRSEQMEREANGPYRSSAQSAKNFTRKRMINGGNRRGSFSQLELLSMTPEEKRAAVAAHDIRMQRELARLKLPSQR